VVGHNGDDRRGACNDEPEQRLLEAERRAGAG
jgi:hypothetical protein